MKVLKRLEKRFADEIFGDFGISGAVVHKPKNGLVVRIVQPPERFRVCLPIGNQGFFHSL